MIRFYERILFVFFCHWIATVGVIITTTAALLFVGLQFTGFENPYDSLIAFGAVPVVFLLGLILIPIGIYVRTRGGGGVKAVLESESWNTPRLVRLGFIVLVATGANLALMSTATYRSVEYMDSDRFCGTVCHVMEPQYTTYQRSVHAEIGCPACHVGPGATSFLSSKLEGVGRLVSSIGDTELPIRIGEANRRRVATTCMNCHAGQERGGSVSLRMIRQFDDDEQSTPLVTLLNLHVASAIHPAHQGGNVQYIAADATRQVIPWTSAGGDAYVAGETPGGDPETMTCIDCHNRVGHEFESIERAVDGAIDRGELARSLPFARRDAVAALTGDTAFPEAANALNAILARNVFEDAALDWGIHVNRIGHDNGCFRCHDGQHLSDAGAALSENCFGCHTLIAIGQANPAILGQLGVEGP